MTNAFMRGLRRLFGIKKKPKKQVFPNDYEVTIKESITKVPEENVSLKEKASKVKENKTSKTEKKKTQRKTNSNKKATTKKKTTKKKTSK